MYVCILHMGTTSQLNVTEPENGGRTPKPTDDQRPVSYSQFSQAKPVVSTAKSKNRQPTKAKYTQFTKHTSSFGNECNIMQGARAGAANQLSLFSIRPPVLFGRTMLYHRPGAVGGECGDPQRLSFIPSTYRITFIRRKAPPSMRSA